MYGLCTTIHDYTRTRSGVEVFSTPLFPYFIRVVYENSGKFRGSLPELIRIKMNELTRLTGLIGLIG